MITIALVSLVLLSNAVPQVGASLPLVPLNLSLFTNSPQNCSTGLTHPGVFVLVEYRVVEAHSVEEWQLLDSVNMEPTGNCMHIPVQQLDLLLKIKGCYYSIFS